MRREKKNWPLKFRESEYPIAYKQIDDLLPICTNAPCQDSAESFLAGIVEQRITMLPDCSSWEALGRDFFDQWAAVRATGDYHDGFDGNGYLKVGSFRVSLHLTGTQLTVRHGNRYGRIIDTHRQGIDWNALLQGMQSLNVPEVVVPRSVGAVAMGLIARKGINAELLPDEVRALAWQAFKGGRMQALQFGDLQGYACDLSSAYPWAARSLLRCDYDCQWVSSTEYQTDAFYGFADATVEIPSMAAGPLAVRATCAEVPGSELELDYPTGEAVRCFISKPEINLLRDMGIPFKIHDAWWGLPTSAAQPFKWAMDMLWSLREWDLIGAKALSVACVGQICSTSDGNKSFRVANRLWQPVYASHVYADVRCRIYRKALEVGLEHVKAFCIDGIIADVPIKVGKPGFGQWRKESEGSYFIATDFFKDRPGNTLYRDAVQGNCLELPYQEYMGVRSYINGACDFAQIGSEVAKTVRIELGTQKQIA